MIQVADRTSGQHPGSKFASQLTKFHDGTTFPLHLADVVAKTVPAGHSPLTSECLIGDDHACIGWGGGELWIRPFQVLAYNDAGRR